MLIWKLLSSFVKAWIRARIERNSGLYCRRAGGLQCLMGSPAGTMTPISSMCDTPTPALSPGEEGGGGGLCYSPSGGEEEGGFLTSRVTPAVINDHLRCAH